MTCRTLLSLLLSASLTTPYALGASETCSTNAMLVFDGSGSMAEMGFNDLRRPRILEAREAVRKVMPHIAPFRKVGLAIYGPGDVASPTSVCNRIDIRFPPERDAGARIEAEINALEPAGETPLTDAVAIAAEVLEFRTRPGLIVLVTDGKETCGGSPCSLAGQLAGEAFDLTVHVIGFKVRGDYFSWNSKEGNNATVAECLAAANNGRYVPAETVEELADALEETLGCRMISSLPRRAG